MNTSFYKTLSAISSSRQALIGITTVLVLQYCLNGLAYYGLLPNIGNYYSNEIVKNSSYLIPGTVAVVLVFLFEGPKGLSRIFGAYLKLAPLGWWVFVSICLILPLYAALLLDDLLYSIILGEEFGHYTFVLPTWEVLATYTLSFVVVAISDELFWIGLIYPRLVASGFSPFKASLLIGLLWGLDYLPFIFTDFFISPGLNIPNLVFGWFAVSPVYLWIYHKTGSALLVVFFNVCMQSQYAAVPVLPVSSGDNTELAMANLTVFLFGWIIWRYFSNSNAKLITDVRG